MRMWRTLMLVVPTILGVAIVLTEPRQVYAQTVGCGSVLGPGGT
jgi:hypothetical protein